MFIQLNYILPINCFHSVIKHNKFSGVAMQPDNLVPLCKFKIIIIIHLFIVFTVNEHENICIAGLNRRTGYATE